MNQELDYLSDMTEVKLPGLDDGLIISESPIINEQ